MGSAIASREHVSHFYETTPEAELPYTYVGDSITLNTAEWNCIADYLGTNQYWRYNGDLSTSFYPDSTLASIKDANWEETITSGSTSKTIPPKYIDVKYGLELYLEQAGYQLDQVKTASHTTDNAGGTFTFEDYKAEIDAGRVVIIGITEHAMVGYGYDDATREIILDDTYDHDCRMKWGGTYYYSGEERQLEDIMTVVFDTTGLSQAAVPVNHDLNGDSRSDILMANSSGYAGTWFVQDDASVWGNLSTLSGSWEILGTATPRLTVFRMCICMIPPGTMSAHGLSERTGRFKAGKESPISIQPRRFSGSATSTATGFPTFCSGISTALWAGIIPTAMNGPFSRVLGMSGISRESAT